MYPQPQSGILPENNRHALMLTFKRYADVDPQRLVKALSKIPLLTDETAVLQGDAGLTSVVAIGSEDWDALFPAARPAELQGFPQLGETVIPLPATPTTGFLLIRSELHDLNFELARRCEGLLAGLVEWLDDIHGFRYLDSRDLTGFVDGTENPKGDEVAPVALVGADDPGFAGGSYLHTQRFIHNMRQWEQQDDSAQEAIIGRSKWQDQELADEVKPATAHIARVVIEENGEELEIVRRGMPYGQLGEMGLYFLSFARTPRHFNRMLARMFQKDAHGQFDHLLKFTRPVSGGAYFAPSRTWLELQGAAIKDLFEDDDTAEA